MEHSNILGGSSANIRLNCPASLKLTEDLPPQPESEYMKEGTALHAVMEQMLLDETIDADVDVDHWVGMTVEDVDITVERIADKIIPAWQATQEAFTRLDVDDYVIEAPVQYTPVDNSFGTCDILAKGRDGLVVVLDYKFGAGVMVSPVENRQLMFYATASMHDERYRDFWSGDPDQPVVLGIIQPAAERPLQTWQCTAKDLVLFDVALRQSMHDAVSGSPAPKMGDWCRWCRAAPVCPAKLEAAGATNRLKQEHLNELTVAMALAEELEPWIKQVRRMAHEQLERGDTIAGYKLVNKRASRKWNDMDEALNKLRHMRGIRKELYVKEALVTPPALEKICKAKDIDFDQFDDYIISVSSGTTVAPFDDRREAVQVAGAKKAPSWADE